MLFKTALLLLPLALAQDPPADAAPADVGPPAETVVDLAVATPELSTLTEAVTFVGLASILANWTGVTVFAPTDEAFEAVDEKYTTPEWGYHLADILLYHVTNGTVLSSDLEQDMAIPMFNYEYANITSLDPPMINNATIIGADVLASNGAVHVIDQVLLPMSATTNIVELAVESPDFSTLVSLLEAADLVETLGGEGPFTVFAPINSAFAALDEATVAFLTSPEGKSNLTDILTYHVASGIYHSGDAPPGTSTIDMLSGDELFVTTPTLSELFGLDGNFTLPNATNFLGEIFGMDGPPGADPEAPPTATMKKKQAEEAAAAGKEMNVTEDELADIEALWGISLNGGAANVIWPDILLSNGILHIIDAVILPSQTEGLEEDSIVDQIGELAEDLVGGLLDAVTSKSNPDNEGF